MEEITETLKVELFVSEDEDYPDEAVEHKFDVFVKTLVQFVRRVADKHTSTLEDERAMELAVALGLLEGVQSRYNGDRLRARLDVRLANSKGTRTLTP